MDQYDTGCVEPARAVLLGATNSWFPITLSALAIPLARDPISQLVQDGWEYFADLGSEGEIAITVKALKRTGALAGVLTDPGPPTDWPHFLSKKVEAPKDYKKMISGVLLLERLREVNALLGFTRVEAPEETANPADRPPRAALCKARERSLPPCQGRTGSRTRLDRSFQQDDSYA
jgi:hypothetical protein